VTAPAISIIIVSYNARADLERCLESLAAAPPRASYEIVVVDNASSDGSVDAVRQWPNVRVLVQSSNRGFAAANNAGIRVTTGELILLLNSDTIVPAGAIESLSERLRAHPDAAVAGPRLVDATGATELSFGPMIAPLAELRQKMISSLNARGFAPAVAWVNRLTAHERYVDWVSGAALLVYRKDAQAAGLLDERYFLYTEDVDLCAAIRARGRRVLFTPKATITHLRGRSRASAPAASTLAYRRSQLAFYQKHHPRWVPALKAYLKLKRQGPDE
jgi:GT2 family glycosyltransferase